MYIVLVISRGHGLSLIDVGERDVKRFCGGDFYGMCVNPD